MPALNRSLSKPLALTLNAAGVCLLFYSLRQINNAYERLYELAATGTSSVGAKVADFPPSVTLYVGLIAAAGACWWLAERIGRRHVHVGAGARAIETNRSD